MRRRLEVDADLVVTRGPDRIPVRASGDTLDVQLPGLAAAWRLRGTLGRAQRRRAAALLRAAGLRVRVRLGRWTLLTLGA